MNNSLNHNISNLTERMSNALKLVSEYTGLMKDIPGDLKNTSQLQNFSLNSDTPPDLIAVDGSYSFVLNVSSVWIVILRIGALHYEFKEDSNGIGYVLKHNYLEESPEVISTYHPIVEQQSEVHQKLFNISAKSRLVISQCSQNSGMRPIKTPLFIITICIHSSVSKM